MRTFDRAASRPERICAAHLLGIGALALGIGALAAVLACGAAEPLGGPPERVILVTIDTLRADRVGCYGASRARTPNLDAIAAAGVRFDAAMAPTPTTLPSHTSLMTALNPPSHGVRHNSIFALDDRYPTLAERMREAGYATAAIVGAAVLDSRFGLDRGFDHYDDQMGPGRSGVVGYAERRANRVVDAALDWLAGAPDHFFLWVHFYDPHAAHDPPVEFASAFAAEPYAGEIAFVDAQLGRLLDAIRSRWGDAGTLIVATSDHGESLGEHGEIAHSYTIYQATQRIPLLLSGPGLPSARVVHEVARLIDVAPTILSIAGAAPLPEAAGRDLRPLIAGTESSPRTVYLETLATQLDHGWSPLLGVRSGRFKFIRAPRSELYDLKRDPGEVHDLIGSAPEIAARLDRVLDSLLESNGSRSAPLPLPEADRLRLESLGYAIPGTPAWSDGLGEVGGIDPKDEIDVLSAIADAHEAIEAGRNGEALRLLRAQGDRGDVVASMRAAAALAAGEFAEAERDARRVLRRQSNRPDVQVILARALEKQGRHAEASIAFESAAALDPTSSAAQTGLGRTLQSRGRDSAAVAAYRQAIRNNPANVEPIWRLGALLLETGQTASADRVLRQLPIAVANHVSVALLLSRAEEAAGRPAAALVRLRAALGERPDNPRLQAAAGRLERLEAGTQSAGGAQP